MMRQEPEDDRRLGSNPIPVLMYSSSLNQMSYEPL